MTDILIRNAELNDIHGILAIFEQNLLANKTNNHHLQEKGFLAFGLTYEDIKQEILDHNHTIALVAEINNEILGFTLGNDFKIKNPGWKSNMQLENDSIETLTSNRIFYHDYIARQLNSKGVGKKLLTTLIKKAVTQNYSYILCEIAHKPYLNKASVAFHEQFGFKCIGTINKNHFTLGVYLLKI